MPDRNIIGNWTTLVMPLAASSVLANDAMHVAEGQERDRAEHDERRAMSSEPTVWTPKTITPTPTMITAWTSAMSSRISDVRADQLPAPQRRRREALEDELLAVGDQRDRPRRCRSA